MPNFMVKGERNRKDLDRQCSSHTWRGSQFGLCRRRNGIGDSCQRRRYEERSLR
jgi:hypothetical protein